MNRVIASVYAITIGGDRKAGDWSDEVKTKLIDKIPDLIEEIKRLETIAHDPFVEGCLHVREAIVSAARQPLTQEVKHE